MKRLPTGAVTGLLLAAITVALATGPAQAEPYRIAVLRALDKVTAKTTVLRGEVGGTVLFGGLVIHIRACDKRPPEEPPETAAFVEIVEHADEPRETWVFRGWMFASSPGLSAMEHPIYDVWLLDCEDKLATADQSSSEESAE